MALDTGQNHGHLSVHLLTTSASSKCLPPLFDRDHQPPRSRIAADASDSSASSAAPRCVRTRLMVPSSVNGAGSAGPAPASPPPRGPA
jgi:hypothetical protein